MRLSDHRGTIHVSSGRFCVVIMRNEVRLNYSDRFSKRKDRCAVGKRIERSTSHNPITAKTHTAHHANLETVHYRLYKPEDFDALYSIEEVCFQPPFRFGRRYMQRLVTAPNAVAWIAEDYEFMAGFAIAEWTPAIDGARAYIQTIEVAPHYRGQGVGRQLLNRIEDSAHQTGAAILWLHVEETNAAAIHLYETHGFIQAGEEENYYAPGRGALLYRKCLTRSEKPEAFE